MTDPRPFQHPGFARLYMRFGGFVDRHGAQRNIETGCWHVQSPRTPVGMLQDLITPLWSLVAGGCHPNRNTVAAIEASRLVIDEVERIPFGLPTCLAVPIGQGERPRRIMVPLP
jgi:hypothetical protein